MGGPIFNQPVEGVDNGSTGYGVRGSSGRDNGIGVYGKTNRLNGIGVYGYSEEYEGHGVRGYSSVGDGVVGYGRRYGVYGESYNDYGVLGRSTYSDGVLGRSAYRYGVVGYTDEGDAGVYGSSIAALYGVVGEGGRHAAVIGRGGGYSGVLGYGDSYGVRGEGLSAGVSGRSESGDGVSGRSESGDGVSGYSYEGYGVHGYSRGSWAVLGESNSSIAVAGLSSSGQGVHGYSNSNRGVYGSSPSGAGVYGVSSGGYAAYLEGRVEITGRLIKPGGGFKIDHPLNPANKYLSHSFVESPDMKNVYDGVVVLDDNGEAEIKLPDWFGALNKDFRYQLTAIGAPGPNLHIAEEISDADTTTNYSSNNKNNKNNSLFKVAGGTSGMKVSWQVTGIRKDPWANAHRIQVEEDKSDKERGYYIYPDLYGKAAENGISRLLFPTEEERERKKQELLLPP
jgi:hypothetical protein